MQKEKADAMLDKLDLLIASTTMLEKNELTQNILNHLSGAGIIIESITEAKKRDYIPVDSPTKETLLEFLLTLNNNLKELVDDVKKTATENENQVVFCCTLMMAWVKLIPAAALLKYYTEDVECMMMAEKDYNTKLEKVKNVVFIINEDINHKQAMYAVKAIWADVYQKENVIFHEDWKPMISEALAASNISYDNVQCEDCLKKYSKDETLFVFIGFKQGIEKKYGLEEQDFTISI